jgi:hypothetical protein
MEMKASLSTLPFIDLTRLCIKRTVAHSLVKFCTDAESPSVELADALILEHE